MWGLSAREHSACDQDQSINWRYIEALDQSQDVIIACFLVAEISFIRWAQSSEMLFLCCCVASRNTHCQQWPPPPLMKRWRWIPSMKLLIEGLLALPWPPNCNYLPNSTYEGCSLLASSSWFRPTALTACFHQFQSQRLSMERFFCLSFSLSAIVDKKVGCSFIAGKKNETVTIATGIRICCPIITAWFSFSLTVRSSEFCLICRKSDLCGTQGRPAQ